MRVSHKHSTYNPERAIAKLHAATTRCVAAMLKIAENNLELRDYDWFDDVIQQADEAIDYLKKRRSHVYAKD